MNEICSSSFKDFMRKKIDSHIDVTSHDSRVLITLAIEDVVMGVRDTLFDGYLDNFLRLFHTFTLTAFTLVLFLHYHTHLVAFLAGCLDLGVHAWPQLSHF